MNIEWFGQACIRVQAKPGPNNEVTVIFDPYEPSKTGLKLPKLTADVVAVTHDHYDHNYTAGVSGDFMLINTPGEYEVKQMFLYGLEGFHDDEKGAKRGGITMYMLETEGLSVAHLGDIGQGELTTEQMEVLEGVDILILPVGGVYTVDAKKAANLVSQIEPRIIIPIHYKIPGLKSEIESVDKFVKELGLKPETLEKLKISKKDLPPDESKLILLTP